MSNNLKISKMLNISRPTVIRYINMSPEDFQEELESRNQRSKKPAVYHDDILTWLRQHPEMTASQIYDWLEEKYQELQFNESTARNYVRWLRKEYDIPKDIEIRQYEAMEDPPMGKQLQADFGQIIVESNTGNKVKLFVMCFVLSNSRYKYCEWQDRHFTTDDVIKKGRYKFYRVYHIYIRILNLKRTLIFSKIKESTLFTCRLLMNIIRMMYN